MNYFCYICRAPATRFLITTYYLYQDTSFPVCIFHALQPATRLINTPQYVEITVEEAKVFEIMRS